MTKIRLTPKQRREIIVTAAVRIARDRGGLWAVSHGSVAKRCTVPTNERLVRHYFATKQDIWDAVKEAAPELGLTG